MAAYTRPPRRSDAWRTWLAKVVRNLALNHLRSAARRQRHERDAARPERVLPVASDLERVEALTPVSEAIAALPKPSRVAVRLTYFHGLSLTDVARCTGVPYETARARLRRGLERLKRDLGAPA